MASESPVTHRTDTIIDMGLSLHVYFVLPLIAVITFSTTLTARVSGAAQNRDTYLPNEHFENSFVCVKHMERIISAGSHYSITYSKGKHRRLRAYLQEFEAYSSHCLSIAQLLYQVPHRQILLLLFLI